MEQFYAAYVRRSRSGWKTWSLESVSAGRARTMSVVLSGPLPAAENQASGSCALQQVDGEGRVDIYNDWNFDFYAVDNHLVDKSDGSYTTDRSAFNEIFFTSPTRDIKTILERLRERVEESLPPYVTCLQNTAFELSPGPDGISFYSEMVGIISSEKLGRARDVLMRCERPKSNTSHNGPTFTGTTPTVCSKHILDIKPVWVPSSSLTGKAEYTSFGQRSLQELKSWESKPFRTQSFADYMMHKSRSAMECKFVVGVRVIEEEPDGTAKGDSSTAVSSQDAGTPYSTPFKIHLKDNEHTVADVVTALSTHPLYSPTSYLISYLTTGNESSFLLPQATKDDGTYLATLFTGNFAFGPNSKQSRLVHAYVHGTDVLDKDVEEKLTPKEEGTTREG